MLTPTLVMSFLSEPIARWGLHWQLPSTRRLAWPGSPHQRSSTERVRMRKHAWACSAVSRHGSYAATAALEPVLDEGISACIAIPEASVRPACESRRQDRWLPTDRGQEAPGTEYQTERGLRLAAWSS
jgi:hypothetical protein